MSVLCVPTVGPVYCAPPAISRVTVLTVQHCVKERLPPDQMFSEGDFVARCREDLAGRR